MDLVATLKRKHFFYFVTCCKAWLKYLQISDWDIRYYFQESEEGSPRAGMGVECPGNRLAAIFLFDEWDLEPTPRNLWVTAFHEIFEVLLADIHILSQSREWSEERYDREHHRIIRILENTVFTDMWGSHEIFDIQPAGEVPEYTGPEIPGPDIVEEVSDS